MKQGKGSGVVIMNKPKYHAKYLELLNTDQFTKFNHDPAKKIEVKKQRVLRTETKLTSQEYPASRLYPTGSCRDQFYSMSKIHKLFPADNINKLPMRP